MDGKNFGQIRKHDAILAVVFPAVVLFRPDLRYGPLRDILSGAGSSATAGLWAQPAEAAATAAAATIAAATG